MKWKCWFCGLAMVALMLGSCRRQIGIDGFVRFDPEMHESHLEIVPDLPEAVDHPIEGARVEVFDGKAKRILDGRSDRYGNFFLVQNVGGRSGSYHLRITHDDFCALDTEIELVVNQGTYAVAHLARHRH